ncbi:hypothetical protein Plim_1511 [Planctopirus limnophila DSM 3776]|uniref:Uncharacterized protein n=1 Tax=Planctopirus limnophila (strain ATCC 43296 / DSM 3776 / IFAM 1008 / Mu 290) TaxID=521674 RepID=D5SW59_PLAL2|nr:hypothetical protein Plim_1511 [Planctopirus limnophila DSM 3776]
MPIENVKLFRSADTAFLERFALGNIGKIFDVEIAVPSELDQSATCDLNEVTHTTGRHRFPDNIPVAMFTPLTLLNGSYYIRN